MTIKSTLNETTEPARAGSVQRLVRRWYVVEGETGVSWQAGGAKGLYTGVSQWHDSLKEARKELKEWQYERSGLHWARIVEIVETRTVLETKPPTHPVMRKPAKRKSPNIYSAK
jgi:hypothetical protein